MNLPTVTHAFRAAAACLWMVALAVTSDGAQYAVLAGVWDYDSDTLALEAPQNDLILMRTLLADERYEPGSVIVLENPTKSELVASLEGLADRIGPADTFLFYFSGHGTRIIDKFGADPGDEARGKYPDLDDEALLPADADVSRPETYLLDDELGALIGAIGTRDVTCIVDTCYSGDILKAPRLGPAKGASGPTPRRRGASRPQDILDDATEYALLLAAAPHNEVVHELRIPVAGRQLPVSALTYSIYRHAGRMAGMTYRQLAQATRADHEEWSLPWTPVLEGPAARYDESTPWRPASMAAEEAIELYAVDEQRFETTRHRVVALGGVDVDLSRLRAAGVRRSAIVIGVDDYAPPFGALRYAGDDAKAMKEVLQDAGFMVTLMTPDSLLQPTRQNIVDQLEWHASMADLDMLTVYLSGHGEDVDGEGYFVPMDATEPLASNALGVGALFDILSQAKAKRRFVMVDACRVAPKQAFVSSLARQGSETDIVFTACDEGQYAPEVPELGHGLFTHFLLTGLRDDAGKGPAAATADGDVTVLGLLDYVMRGIDDWYASIPPDQRPQQQVTPRVLYNGRYISLLSNEDVDTALVAAPPPRVPAAASTERPMSPRPDHVPFLLSVLPGISMPIPVDGDVSTTFSLNLFAGYVGGIEGAEIGYGLNRVREGVHGAQFAGLGNLVGGRVTGFQAAGAANVTGGGLRGFQAAGAVNLLDGGARLARLREDGDREEPVMGLEGVQAAGALNILSGDHSQGAQLAGAVNLAAGSLRGVQMSGAVNVAERLFGAQFGVVNVADSVRGAQFGVVNVAGTMSGFQAGIINVADKFEGVPLGLLNYSRNGRWDLEISGDETFPLLVGLRTGTEHFYSILAVAGQSESTPRRWGMAAGFGGRIPVGSHGIHLDAMHYKINEDEAWTDELHLLSKLRLTFGLRLADQMSLFAGVTGNVLVSRLNDGSHLDLSGDAVYETKRGRTWVRIWPGVVAGVTF
ncbi:caspase family protein [Candidatus Poribacteria bacterium]|nr:caspase family protein [Candidatus Poribacteria bacterium]MBT7099363.1 caspase family protein [Candidatus Poribacteria bacterium]MBT7808305.1 caspase family protein [Candidatus Poribacteria bacterium]